MTTYNKGSPINIGIERIRGATCRNDGVFIKPTWDVINQKVNAMIREQALEEGESKIMALKAELTAERRRGDQRLRLLGEHLAQLVGKCSKHGDARVQCEITLQELRQARAESEQKEQEIWRELDRQRTDNLQRAQDAVDRFKVWKMEVSDLYLVRVRSERNGVLLQHLDKIPDDELRGIVQRLHEEFQVELLGIDTNLCFLLRSPLEREIVLEVRQQRITEVLTEMLQTGTADRVQWHEMFVCACKFAPEDITLGEPFPKQVTLMAKVQETSDTIMKTGFQVATFVGVYGTIGVGAGAVNLGFAAGVTGWVVVAAPFFLLGAAGRLVTTAVANMR